MSIVSKLKKSGHFEYFSQILMCSQENMPVANWTKHTSDSKKYEEVVN